MLEGFAGSALATLPAKEGTVGEQGPRMIKQSLLLDVLSLRQFEA